MAPRANWKGFLGLSAVLMRLSPRQCLPGGRFRNNAWRGCWAPFWAPFGLLVGNRCLPISPRELEPRRLCATSTALHRAKASALRQNSFTAKKAPR
jgi:hypothetical protein